MMLKMKNKSFFLIFVLLITARLRSVHGSVALTTYHAVQASVVAYRTLSWFSNFGSYLMTYPDVTDIPKWVWDHPPVFLANVLLYYSPSILNRFLSSEKIAAYKKYSTSAFSCGDYILCSKVKNFLAIFARD